MSNKVVQSVRLKNKFFCGSRHSQTIMYLLTYILIHGRIVVFCGGPKVISLGGWPGRSGAKVGTQLEEKNYEVAKFLFLCRLGFSQDILRKTRQEMTNLKGSCLMTAWQMPVDFLRAEKKQTSYYGSKLK